MRRGFLADNPFKISSEATPKTRLNYGDTSSWYSSFLGGDEDQGDSDGIGGVVGQVFANAEKRQERDAMINALSSRAAQPFGGEGRSGRVTDLGDGTLSQVTPDSFDPIVIPGMPAGPAGPSTGQRVAGAATGALSGFAAGGPIGGIIGAIGGLFG